MALRLQKAENRSARSRQIRKTPSGMSAIERHRRRNVKRPWRFDSRLLLWRSSALRAVIKSVGDRIKHLQLALLHGIRQGRVVQRWRKFLAFRNGPFQKIHQRLALVALLLLI